MSKKKHRLRGALLLQAWWRGCLVRRRGRRRRPPSLSCRFKDVVNDIKETWREGDWVSEPATQTGPWSSGMASLRSYLSGEMLSREPSRVIEARVKSARCVFICLSETGGGHRASAVALQAALTEQYGERFTVRLVDFVLEATLWPCSKSPDVYQVLGKMPMIYKQLYDCEGASVSWRQTKTYQMVWWP